ncbi:DegV family protein with EDD domain [Trichococcus patagoniensis]|uniref:DegV family protein with EDD domain n=1 Tax=Trichococcus patagoniensis TaxID=382641 RepID=A0A2T5IPP2_9LACT|nr:DegV family protein [Trichococcus patagoniensis]PTQ85793.1 DegV family protein with EDD domain [Trichococcus patagoniensis]
MSRVILTTESGADVPADLAEQHNIQVVPMHVIMDDIDHLDGSFPVSDLVDYYDRTKKTPSTTATNPNEYTAFFENIRSKYPDCSIVHIGYTSKASSSFQSAVLAAEDFENIHLIDALNVSGGLAAIVLYAADLLEKEPDIAVEKLVAAVEAVVPRTHFSFMPSGLEFLRAGGRVSNAAYLGASLLKIKPTIELIDGKLVSTKKYRGKMSRVVVDFFDDYLKAYDIDNKKLYLILSLGLDKAIMTQMENYAKEKGFPDVTWVETGCVITSHGGPGAFGIAGIEKQ